MVRHLVINSALIVTLFALATVGPLAVTMARADVDTGDPVLIIFEPGRDAAMNIGSAGGTTLITGAFDWLAVGYSKDPDFFQRLRISGAMTILPFQIANFLCAEI